jgi:hypothetical protein
MQSLTTLLVLLTIASVTSSLVYLTLRFLSVRFKTIASITALPAIALIYLSLPSDPYFPYWKYLFWKPKFSIFIPLVIIFGLIGVKWHQNSCNEPTQLLTSFALVCATITSAVSVLLLSLGQSPSLRGAYVNAFIVPKVEVYVSSLAAFELMAWVFIISQTITTPFWIWIWNTSRLRPGVDKHFDN